MTDLKNLEVGTVIRLKEGLEEGKDVGYFRVTDSIEELAGKAVVIEKVQNQGNKRLHYTVRGGVRWITPEMIEEVVEEAEETAQESNKLNVVTVFSYQGEMLELKEVLSSGIEVYVLKGVVSYLNNKIILHDPLKSEVVGVIDKVMFHD